MHALMHIARITLLSINSNILFGTLRALLVREHLYFSVPYPILLASLLCLQGKN